MPPGLQSLRSLPSVELVGRIKDGEREALEELCRRYLPRLHLIVRQRLGAKLRRKVDSIDVVHDALMQGIKNNLRSFDFRDEFALIRYLSQIALNKIRDYDERWKRQKRDVQREVQLPSRESTFGVSDRSPDTPSRIVMLREDVVLLQVAMDQLRDENPDYADLIVAIELETQPIQDVATQLQQSPDAVRMRRNRAMARLAEIVVAIQGGAP